MKYGDSMDNFVKKKQSHLVFFIKSTPPKTIMMRSGMMRPILKRYSHVAVLLVSEQRHILIEQEKLPGYFLFSSHNNKKYYFIFDIYN